MSTLPPNWIETEIGNLAQVVAGGTPQASDETNFAEPGTGIAWLTPADLSGYKHKEIAHGKRDLTKKGLDSSSAKLMPKGAVVFSSRAPIGYVAIAANEICTNQGFKSFVFTEHVYPSYAFYYLKSIKDLAESWGTGTTFKELSGAVAKKLPFKLAPLNEQKRIADKLDSILAKVDRAQERLDKIPGILKRFRQSVLAAATSGELTKDWRGDTSDKKTIYSTWEIINLPDTWEVKLLPEVATTRLGKMLDKNKNEGIATKYIGNINVRWNSFDLEDLKEILVSEREISELSILDGDLILCEGGVPGRGAVWRGGKNNLVFQKALHRIRFNDTVLPEFGLYCVEDDFNSNKLATLYTGTTIKHLTGQALNTYPLRIPPLEEQHEIVSKVEVLLAKAAQAESQFIKSKVMLDRLIQSILAKAFRGELVPQDPNDVPASELLKRIKSSEIATKPKKKSIPKRNVPSTAKNKIAESARTNDLVKFRSTTTTDLDAENDEVIDRLRVSYLTEIQKAQELLVDAKFSVEQFRSITDFNGGYDELKALIMNLLKGIPSVSEPLLAMESWDEKSGDYLMRLVKQK